MSGIPAGAGSLLGKRLGKYEILALLALGGTAEIYLARIGGAAGFEKYVVVKCLHDHLADDQEFVKMFLDEARLAAHLDHSNIVQTMELGEHENRYYMVMEFLAGLSMAMMVRRAGERLLGGRIPVPLVLNMVAQSCAGLHYAHERVMNGKPLNIVHRDISPQNLVVSFEGVVKVVDFGIAKAELRETRTRSGTIKGKFAYMSPEQCVANNVDRRTDVFALGVIAHEMLTGRRLFKKPSPYETYQSVIECVVEPPSQVFNEIDPAIDPIIMRAVAKDKERRYPTAEAFGDAILGYLHHRGIGSGPGEVSRFFDVSFSQEIEEHGARMRELISGREVVAEVGIWGADDEKKAYETVDITGGDKDKPVTVDTADLHASSGSLSEVLGDLDVPTGDEDMPAERTRIEANPLEQMNEMEAASKAPPRGVQQQTPTTPQPRLEMRPSGPLPLPPTPTAPAKAPGMPSSGRFPDLANLPTMIAESDDEPSGTTPVPKVAPELARTEIGQPLHQGPEARTMMDMQAPNLNGGPGRPMQPPQQMPQVMSPQMPPTMQVQPPMQAQPMMPMPQQISRPNLPPVGPTGYPVMNKELSAHIASGATVFPSMGSGPHDSQRAADLASPVGGQYPGDVDWANAAAAPARALPPWMLAALFAAAIVAALVVTLIIAKIAR